MLARTMRMLLQSVDCASSVARLIGSDCNLAPSRKNAYPVFKNGLPK